MGYELRRWLADRLPDGMSSGERLVALEIADQAHERTRLAYGRELMDTVIRRSGLSDAKQVGKVLAKLGAAGIELRVPIKGRDGQPLTDKLGRVMYACKGHELTLRIPKQNECPALKVPPAGELQSSPAQGPIETKAPPAGAQRSPAGGTKLPRAGGPTSHDHSDHSSLAPLASADPPATPAAPVEREIDPLVQKLMNDHAATEDEAVAVIDQVRAERRIGNLAGWATSTTGQLDIKQRLYALRAPTRDSPTPSRSGLPDWCGQCNDGDPAARFNPKFRYRHGQMCHCHPDNKDAAA